MHFELERYDFPYQIEVIMAERNKRRTENTSGNWFVDENCIDCDTCRWLAPGIFARIDSASAVSAQPASPEDEEAALSALYACPTHAIGWESKTGLLKPELPAKVRTSFPRLLLTTSQGSEIYYCGYHSEKSFGAASYLIKTTETSILVDCPRFVPVLVRNIHDLGGIDLHYFTHRDDVADEALFHREFVTDRVIHKEEAGAISHAEHLLPAEMNVFPANIRVFHVPGHTRGHTVLQLDNEVLFSGDHLAWSDRLQHLIAFKDACWYSWQAQIDSMKLLFTEAAFKTVLPGHGRAFYGKDLLHTRRELKRCIEWMQTFSLR